MAVDLSTLSDYAWSDIAKAAKVAMVNSALGGAQLTINGHLVQRITIDEARALYAMASEMANAEAGNGGAGPGDVLVTIRGV